MLIPKDDVCEFVTAYKRDERLDDIRKLFILDHTACVNITNMNVQHTLKNNERRTSSKKAISFNVTLRLLTERCSKDLKKKKKIMS